MMTWRSSTTGREYPDRDALMAAEANGWVVVQLLHSDYAAVVCGPWETQQQARNAVGRLKTANRRNGEEHLVSRYVVRPLWKEGVDRL